MVNKRRLVALEASGVHIQAQVCPPPTPFPTYIHMYTHACTQGAGSSHLSHKPSNVISNDLMKGATPHAHARDEQVMIT
eukprot:1148645-Pelagomonas_calceolata.AAC.10